jgi:hypothetical protein
MSRQLRSAVAPRVATAWMRDVKRRRERQRAVVAEERSKAPPPIVRVRQPDGTLGDPAPYVPDPAIAAARRDRRRARRREAARVEAEKQRRQTELKANKTRVIAEVDSFVERLILNALGDEVDVGPVPDDPLFVARLRKVGLGFRKRACP